MQGLGTMRLWWGYTSVMQGCACVGEAHMLGMEPLLGCSACVGMAHAWIPHDGVPAGPQGRNAGVWHTHGRSMSTAAVAPTWRWRARALVAGHHGLPHARGGRPERAAQRRRGPRTE